MRQREEERKMIGDREEREGAHFCATLSFLLMNRHLAGPVRALRIVRGLRSHPSLLPVGFCRFRWYRQSKSTWHSNQSIWHSPNRAFMSLILDRVSCMQERRKGRRGREETTEKPRSLTIMIFFGLFLDFSGWCRLYVTGTGGTTVTLRHAEILMSDGSGMIYTENLRTAKATDTYTLKVVLLSFSPQFTFSPHFIFSASLKTSFCQFLALPFLFVI